MFWICVSQHQHLCCCVSACVAASAHVLRLVLFISRSNNMFGCIFDDICPACHLLGKSHCFSFGWLRHCGVFDDVVVFTFEPQHLLVYLQACPCVGGSIYLLRFAEVGGFPIG